MHVFIADQEVKYRALQQFRVFEDREGAIPRENKRNFFHAEIIFCFAAFPEKLGKILHRQFAGSPRSVKPFYEIGHTPVFTIDQTVQGSLNADSGGHPHGKVFVFRQRRKCFMLGFQDVRSLPVDDFKEALPRVQPRTDFGLTP